jgi:hypothetical protein
MRVKFFPTTEQVANMLANDWSMVDYGHDFAGRYFLRRRDKGNWTMMVEEISPYSYEKLSNQIEVIND